MSHVSLCFAVVSWPFHSDRDLVNKLYNEDFEHISDDNVGRIDLETAMWMFQGWIEKDWESFFLIALGRKGVTSHLAVLGSRLLAPNCPHHATAIDQGEPLKIRIKRLRVRSCNQTFRSAWRLSALPGLNCDRPG